MNVHFFGAHVGQYEFDYLVIFCECVCVCLFANFCFELGGSVAPRRVCCIFDSHSVVESRGALHTHIVRVIYN